MTAHDFLLPLIFLSLFFFFLRPPTDPDLGWHLKYGQQIIEQQRFPRVDTFSSTMSTYAWADSYWLSEVFIYGLFKFGGYVLLSLVFALIAASAVALVFTGFTVEREAIDYWEKIKLTSLTFTAVLLITPFVGIRPQTISLLFFSMTLLLLRNRRYRFLPLLFLLWANFHAGFVLGLAIVWLSWLGTLVDQVIGSTNKSWTKLPSYLITRLPFYPALCTLVTLFNPYGLSLWRTIINDAGSLEIKQQIAEWQPTVLRSDLGLIYFVILFTVLILLGRNFRKESFFNLASLLIFAFLSLASIRHIPLFAVLAVPFASRSLPSIHGRSLKYLYYWLLFTFLGVALISFGYFLKPLLLGQWANRSTLGYGNYPSGALIYLKTQPPGGIGLNTYGWGGYLLWNLPGFKSFIDGRMPGWAYPNEPSFFSEYVKAVDLKPGWREVLDKYSVRWVVLEKTVPLAQALAALPGWHKVYEDDLAVVIRRVNEGVW